MAKKKTTRTRIKPKSLKIKFPRIDFDALEIKRNPNHYDGQTWKLKFNDCNGKPKPKSHRYCIETNVELKDHKGKLFGRAFHHHAIRGTKIYSTGWLPVALNDKHENELRKRKRVFFSFLNDESILFDEFYERILKDKKRHEHVEKNQE